MTKMKNAQKHEKLDSKCRKTFFKKPLSIAKSGHIALYNFFLSNNSGPNKV